MVNLPSLPVLVSFLVAFVASFSRLFTASKPFWGKFPAWLQVLAPQIALALGALGSGLAGGIKSWTDLTVTFVAAGALLLPGAPSNRSSAPLPSSDNTPKAPPLVVLAFSGLFLLLLVPSCSLFGSGGSAWPVLGHCAPSAKVLVAKVEDVLIAGGDYEDSLAELGKTEGYAFVECAVQEAVSALTGRTSASPEEASAVVRGKVFLAKVSAQ